ncbi:IclR family transcriptional regulator [Pseudonocardia kongjuensis]|uniref:IclR family transcriptional regulator n=1 Tax=Pseudonocardia kongjuensis TaxID=102227 RepID=A0ABN1YB24_9PSEU
MSRAATGESSLARAVRVIAAFTPDEPELRVSEIARRSGLHVATASRLVAELVTHGLLERGPHREVRVGVRLWELAARASPTMSLRDAALPYLEDVHAVVGQHTQLGVLDGTDVLFVERLSARDAIINYSRIAGRIPLHLSSSGQVLLAHAPRELQARILAGPLERYTPHSVGTPEALREALAAVRRTGYAVLPGHLHPDAAGVAVPVRGALNEVVAALSVIVPNDGRAHGHVPVLLAAARGIGRTLSAGRAPADRDQ